MKIFSQIYSSGIRSKLIRSGFFAVAASVALCAGTIAVAQTQDDQPQQYSAPQYSQQPYQQEPSQYSRAPMQQSQSPQQGPMFSPTELRNLVAPVALYPDALLSQVLVAATYPQEVIDAEQWIQEDRNLQGRALMAAAQQQNWDPSIQALVAFPNVLDLLNRDLQWTTDLGNAFLSQQADVMNAIQLLRAEARNSGRLRSTPQFQVDDETQNGQSAIEIVPANPRVIYVPYYDPYAVWGAPAYGAYPSLSYAAGIGWGSVFNAVADLVTMLPGFTGWLGPRGWGWALSWFAHALFVNNGFFSGFGFHYAGAAWGRNVWVHDWHHRMGVPYGHVAVASWHHGFAGERNGWRSSSSERGRYGAERGSYGREGYARSYNSRPASGFAHFDRQPESRTATANRSWNEPRGFAGNRATNQRGSYGGSSYRRPSYGQSSRGQSFERSSSSRPYADRSYSARSYGRPSRSERNSFKQSSLGHQSRGNSSFGRESSRGFSSHAPKAPHYKAPHYKAPKMAKAQGGGGGHGSGKRSHRG